MPAAAVKLDVLVKVNKCKVKWEKLNGKLCVQYNNKWNLFIKLKNWMQVLLDLNWSLENLGKDQD